MDEPLKSVYDRAVARDFISLWLTGVKMQYSRASESWGEEANEVDVRLFPVVLRNWLDAVDFYSQHEPSAEAVKDKFTTRFPTGRTVRNVLEHFPEFQQERSKAHEEGKVVGNSMWWENSGKQVTLYIGGLELDFAAAVILAEQLTAELLDNT